MEIYHLEYTMYKSKGFEYVENINDYAFLNTTFKVKLV